MLMAVGMASAALGILDQYSLALLLVFARQGVNGNLLEVEGTTEVKRKLGESIC